MARLSVRGWLMLAVCGLMAWLGMLAGSALGAPERLSSFGPDGTDTTDFERIGSIGLDQQSGQVYVLDALTGILHRYEADGVPAAFSGSSSYISENRIEGITSRSIETTGRPGVAQVAIDSASQVIYVTEEASVRAFQASGEPAEFIEGPGMGTNEIGGFSELTGLAVDASGNIYASDYGTDTVSIFTPTGAFITSFAVPNPLNLAVSPSGVVYVVGDNEAILRFAPSAVPVTETTTFTEGAPISRFNAQTFISGIAVDSSDESLYALEINFSDGWVRRFDSSGALIESIGNPDVPGEELPLGGNSEGIAILGEDKELEPEETVKLYVSDTVANEESQVALFGTRVVIGPPGIGSLRATDVTSDSAVVRGSINPNTGATTYRFEYGLADCAVTICTRIPLNGDVPIGSGSEPVSVSQSIVGLDPQVTYHYRLVAENPLGPPVEASGTFTTQAAGTGFELADARAWELVSPSDKKGGTLKSSEFGWIQAAEDGNGITYVSRSSVEDEPEGNRNLEVSSILSTRSSGAWRSEDITPPNERTVAWALGDLGEFKLFSPDLGSALVEPRDGTNLSPAASDRTPYLRTNSLPPVYTPLVTAKEGFANVPAGTDFGGDPLNPVGNVRLAGATPDLANVFLFSTVSLLFGQPDAPSALYHWEDGVLSPVSELPDSEGGELVDPSEMGSGPGSMRHAVSTDGGRVFWQTGSYGGGGNNLTGLYVRDTVADESFRLDVPQAGSTELGELRPVFQGANADGTVVFFTDTQQLTAGASSSGRDLYRCELPEGSPVTGCATLTNLSAIPGEDAEVLGLASGLSDDGTVLYFVARGKLDSDSNRFGDSAEPGQPNLYRWQEGAGITFIATLAEDDDPTWGIGIAAVPQVNQLSTGTSPSGRYFTFMSRLPLTDQSNLDAVTGDPVQEAFAYDGFTDTLTCVSCNPSGAAPSGTVMPGEAGETFVDPQLQWRNKRVAAILPQPDVLSIIGVSLYQPRSVSDSGRVFFNSVDSLVPADSNGEWDVYQFEPIGTGSCKESSGGSAVVRSADGCISLISSGTADDESVFLDASVSGDDAFFVTPAQLSVLDKDLEMDVYDARVNGTPASLTPSSECTGLSCRSSTVPAVDGAPASATFRGPGNLKPGRKCPKGKKKVRRGGKTRCVRKKSRKGQSPGQRNGKGRRSR